MVTASTETAFAELLRRRRLMAILRAPTAGFFGPVVDRLVDAGVRLIEISLTTPGATMAIGELATRFGGNVIFGAGTVRTPNEVRATVDAGARFVLTPVLSHEVIAECLRIGVPAISGALTPTEAADAWQAGATAVKIFPAWTLGPRYFAALRDPLPELPLVAVGGISETDAAAYLNAGAVAIGAGSPLLGDALVGGDLAALHSRACAFNEAAGGRA